MASRGFGEEHSVFFECFPPLGLAYSVFSEVPVPSVADHSVFSGGPTLPVAVPPGFTETSVTRYRPNKTLQPTPSRLAFTFTNVSAFFNVPSNFNPRSGWLSLAFGYKIMIYYLTIAMLLCITNVTAQTTTYIDSPRKFVGPQTYKDTDTGIIFYVESDGRHVSAISQDGKLLWHRDPFVDAKLEPYRFKFPVIVFLGKPNDWMVNEENKNFIGVGFNSSQFGIMDFVKGDFKFMGQD